jgi:hypothetical protein
MKASTEGAAMMRCIHPLAGMRIALMVMVCGIVLKIIATVMQLLTS